MSCVQIFELKDQDGGATSSTSFKQLIDDLQKSSGAQSVSWAQQAEDAKTIGIIINFTSPAAQNNWMETPAYTQVTKLLASLNAKFTSSVVHLTEDARNTLQAKTVELVTWFYDADTVADPGSELEHRAVKGFAKFGESITASKWSSGGMTAGWDPVSYQRDGRAVRAFTGLIGWQSVDAHYVCKKTPTFTDFIHWMELGHVDIEMCHYKWVENHMSLA